MIELRANNTHWLPGGDPADDQCAHGFVHFAVDEVGFVSERDGELTVSAAALFLLRTLEYDHTQETPVTESNQLFPCCGFNAWLAGGTFPVLVLGCPSGVDLQIQHANGRVNFRRNEAHASATELEWRVAVRVFVEQVDAFYASSPPRNPVTDANDRAGWDAFWTEWKERSHRARAIA